VTGPEPQDQPVVVMGEQVDPGSELLVVRRRRVPFPRGLGTVVLGIICAVLAGCLGIVVVHSARADRERGQLACQVQRLGGQPVGGVNCPRPKTSPVRTFRPSPIPVETLVVVPAEPSQTPVASPRPAPRRTTPPTPHPTVTRSASPHPSPSPSPTCIRLPPPLGCVA
jgi:hypothetical protein